MGKKHTPETIAKMSNTHSHRPTKSVYPKIIHTPHGRFDSIADAARHYGITSAAVFFKLNSESPKCVEWYYIGTQPANHTAVKVINKDGIIYNSIKDAAIAEGFKYHILLGLVRRGEDGWKKYDSNNQ